MNLPPDTPQVIEYYCNICGHKNQLDHQQFHRELAACRKCGANARFRGIIHVLADLLGEANNSSLQKWQTHKDILGIGMSDCVNLPKLVPIISRQI
jgi:hypothetical protein